MTAFLMWRLEILIWLGAIHELRQYNANTSAFSFYRFHGYFAMVQPNNVAGQWQTNTIAHVATHIGGTEKRIENLRQVFGRNTYAFV